MAILIHMWHLHIVDETNLNILYLLDELYFILGFNKFSWIDSHPIRMAPNPHHSQNGYLKIWNLKSEPLNWLSIHSKNNLGVVWILKMLISSFKCTSSSKEQWKEREGRRRGATLGSLWQKTKNRQVQSDFMENFMGSQKKISGLGQLTKF